MKILFTVLVGLVLLVTASTSSALEARGWRLSITDSIANDTQIVIGEIEWLHDDDSNPSTPHVDGSEADLGIVACGWTREAPNLTGNTTPFAVGCDVVSTNFMPDDSMTIPANTRRTRLGKIAFDDITVSYFITKRKPSLSRPFYMQYTWYVGGSAPARTLPDVVAYSITVPNAYLGPGEDGFAPSNWDVEYRDTNTGRWVRITDAAISAANFNDGTDVDASGITVTTGGVAKKLIFNLP